MREVGALRRVVGVRVQGEPVHHRQRPPAGAVRGTHRLDERRGGRRRSYALGPVGAAGRERAAPDAQAGVDGLEGVVGAREQREVRRRGRVRSVRAELREPEAVQIRLVADDDVVEAGQGGGERRGVLRERALGGSVERCRRGAGRIDGDVDLDAGEARRGLDVPQDAELAGRRGGESRPPVGRHPHGREACEPELGHLDLRADEVGGADGVLGDAERHRGSAGVRRDGERETGADRGENDDEGAPQEWGYASSRA